MVIVRWPIVVAAATLIHCHVPARIQHSAELVFRAAGPDGAQVEGVAITVNGEPLGVTSGDGTLRAKVTGSRGERFELAATCPVPMLTGKPLPTFVLHDATALTGAGEAFAVDITCQPRDREVAMLIRTVVDVRGSRRAHAQPLAGVPILLRDEEVARTDASGVAHVVIDAAVGSRVDLTLATSRAGIGAVEPLDPSVALVVEPGSNLAVVDQRFVRQPPPKKAKKKRRRSKADEPLPSPPHHIRVLTGTEADLVDLSPKNKESR